MNHTVCHHTHAHDASDDSSPAAPAPSQEREALLARAVTEKHGRPRSDSYGSRGAQATAAAPSSSSPGREYGSSATNGSPASHQALKKARLGSVVIPSSKEDAAEMDKAGRSAGEAAAKKNGSTLVRVTCVCIEVWRFVWAGGGGGCCDGGSCCVLPGVLLLYYYCLCFWLCGCFIPQPSLDNRTHPSRLVVVFCISSQVCVCVYRHMKSIFLL